MFVLRMIFQNQHIVCVTDNVTDRNWGNVDNGAAKREAVGRMGHACAEACLSCVTRVDACAGKTAIPGLSTTRTISTERILCADEREESIHDR